LSEPEEKDLPFARSSIAAIGSRRRWRLFGGVVEDEGAGADGAREAVDSGEDEGPPGRSMLGVFSGFSGPPETDADAARFLKEAAAVADEEPLVRGMLGSLADGAPASATPRRPRRPSPTVSAT